MNYMRYLNTLQHMPIRPPDGQIYAHESPAYVDAFANTVDSRLTALRLNRGNVFLKKKFYFP
jgi:hypothetical protein